MQKNVQIPENKFIEDLGTGFSYVNFDRSSKVITDEMGIKTVIVAQEQYRVPNPATRDRIIDNVIKKNYSEGKSEAALRKGIINVADPDFVAFNTFVEAIKTKCANEGI